MPKPSPDAVASPIHPGRYVRDTVLTPNGLSVVAAAKAVGVGRPALSNFLNGRVGTTPEMASRIEVAFGISAQHLLDMQSTFDATLAKAKGAPSDARPYVAPFLGIKASDIEPWVERNISARIRLSVFLRTLVNSTGIGISKIDFPGNDDAERHGWDGYVEAEHPTQWIPRGRSGWEFGTNKDPKEKADGDYAKSVKAITKAERDQITFVFVTPRHWPGKAEWVRQHQAKRQWADVRAYDSSDLEQWLEQSVAAQAWFANETLRDASNVRSLDRCWADWADVADPPLVGSLFLPAIESARRTLVSRLSSQPDGPTIIAADSIEEALAFLAQIFGPAGGDELAKYRDRVLVFDQPGVLPRLAQGTKDFVAVATNLDVEREFGPLARLMQTITVYPRNAANATAHVVLEPLNHEAFRKALEEMGCGRDDVASLSNASGRSLTVLRRRLANVPAVSAPHWATGHETATRLIPFLFVGAWSSTNAADQAALVQLGGADCYEKLEKECQRLVHLNDAPLWSVGTYRGVISKIDLLFAIAATITAQDLQRYFEIARKVLGEDDPTLDLPEADRWMASFRGKSREFSAVLRKGISETLVLLAVYGNSLFQLRLGFDCEAAVARLVRGLLTPLKTRILEANDRDLTAYAEAAPAEFLSILAEDLQSGDPACYGLMRPADSSLFGNGCPRTGLLWALEGLAWNPETLPRAALILAQLAGIEINDNWVNKPIHSLQSIFRAWMPQTAADNEARVGVIRLLARKFPNIAWRICVAQFSAGSGTGDYSHKPTWRNDAYGFGEPFGTWQPITAFVRVMVSMALNWDGGYTREMLCDLIERAQVLSEDDQDRVWSLVRSWSDGGAKDEDKAFVREKIRVTFMSPWSAVRAKNADFVKLSADAKAMYQSLEPSDLLSKHEWLFREQWVAESADEFQSDATDYQSREERIAKLRAGALGEIFEERGLEGVLKLAEIGKAAYTIGSLVIETLLRQEDVPDFLVAALTNTPGNPSWAMKNLISGALNALQVQGRSANVLENLQKELAQTQLTTLLLLAPFRSATWRMVDQLEDECRRVYWCDVAANWGTHEESEATEAIERLLEAKRPRAAFAYIHFKLETVGPELLFRLLSEMAAGGSDAPGQYQLDSYYVQQAFSLLNKSSALTLDQMAGLEFAYMEVLGGPWNDRGESAIPNLERYVETHPDLFVQAIVWSYRRSDEASDPPEWMTDPDKAQLLAERGYRLLDSLKRMPGHDDFGVLRAENLLDWIQKVRSACRELGRLEIADQCIGKLLARASVGADGVWPCEPVRQVMEDVQSRNIMSGARVGRYNARGAHWRAEGGGQERALADEYRAWADSLQYSYPFVSSELLAEIVRTYEQEANREDTEAGIRKRLS